MKKYEKPVINIKELATADLLTVSGVKGDVEGDINDF